ncbi:MAG: hypothetical protein K6E71_07875 [Lachnospiraceae bacterium]|nr:hypothetical protein [Lachnospiraceae bacterium]
MIGPIGTAEYERLTTRLGRERYLRRRPAGFGEDTDLSARIALAARADRELSSATGTMSGTNAGIAAMATNRAFAALAAIGREATAVTLLLSVPEDMPEATVRDYLRAAYAASSFEDVAIAREKREDVLAHVSAFGAPAGAADSEAAHAANPPAQASDAAAEAAESAAAGNSAEWFVVMAGTAGIEGTVLLYEANREQMEAKYPKHFLQKAAELPETAVSAELIRAGLANGAAAAVPGGDGGVYGALWKLGEKLRAGMEIALPDIPIAQITIEVCEVTDCDPYRIPGGGCVLFVTANPDRLLTALAEAAPQVEAAVIGRLTKDAARTLQNRGETRYLEPYRGGR